MASEKKILNATLTVESVARISEHFLRIVFSSNKTIEVDPYWIAPVLKLLFPLNDQLVFPEADENNRIVWQAGLRERVRTYSIQHVDVKNQHIAIDFAIHEKGIATIWAQKANKGDQIGVIRVGAKRRFEAPENWLFLGDIAALPAIGYSLAQLPKDHEARAIIEVRDNSDCAIWGESEKIQYLVNPMDHVEAILNALKQVDLSQITQIWGGMETDKARLIRDWVRENHPQKTFELKVISYWRQGFAEGEFKHSD